MHASTVRVVVVSLVVAALSAASVDAPWLGVTFVISATSPREEDRRRDAAVRRHVQQLLELIRDFYSTCHMVAVGQLSATKAKERAREVEEKVNALMNEVLERTGDTEAAEIMEEGRNLDE